MWNRQLDIYGRVRHKFVHPSFGGSRDQRVCEREDFHLSHSFTKGSTMTLKLNLLITGLGIIALKLGLIFHKTQ